MQKWCPEPFDTQDRAPSGSVAEVENFEPDVAGRLKSDDSEASGFRSESGFADRHTLLGHLTRKERAQLFDLVEQDLASEYQTREEELLTGHLADIKSHEEKFHQLLQVLTEELDTAFAGHLKEISTASARLAIQLAEKIVRRSVALDPDILARVLETAQYKLQEQSSLIVTLNPEDAAVLNLRPDILKGLKISQVKSDRRIERGGCTIKSGHQEWDATITRQLESLGEIVEEAIDTADKPGKILPREESHEPELG